MVMIRGIEKKNFGFLQKGAQFAPAFFCQLSKGQHTRGYICTEHSFLKFSSYPSFCYQEKPGRFQQKHLKGIKLCKPHPLLKHNLFDHFILMTGMKIKL